MRLRKIAGAEEAVENSPFVVTDPEKWRGNWHTFFENDHPLHIEVGTVKGRFLMTMAEENQDVNYIGIELYSSVLYRAVQKMEEKPLPNLRFLCIHAERLCEIFAENEVDRIYLNFSDPWPKERHKRRRLTSKVFLDRYERILKSGGLIEFKTDNQDLFDFSLEEIKETRWILKDSTRDLHHDPKLSSGNVMTEYEEKFSALHNRICKLILEKP